jgi:hypothetical protein
MATSRLYSTEKKLQQNESLAKEYQTTITVLAIFGGKRQLPPIMPPNLNYRRQFFAVDEFLCH